MRDKMNLAGVQLLFFSALFLSGAAAAEFSLNFDPYTAPNHTRFVPGGENLHNGRMAGNDGSRMYQSVVNIGGVDYLRTVIGDLNANGMTQDFYTTVTNLNRLGTGGTNRPFSPDSGGNERVVIGTTGQTGTAQSQINALPGKLVGNAKDPFGETVAPASGYKPYDLSGVGTNNPSRVVLRMRLQDGSMSQEVYKPLSARKPKISHKISEGDMALDFVADMRGVTYTDGRTVVPLINRLSVNGSSGEGMPQHGAGDFDLSMAQNSTSSAGQYTFTPGTGWNNPNGWDVDDSTFNEGSYNYAGESSMDVFNVAWKDFFSTSYNSGYCRIVDNRINNRNAGSVLCQ